MPIRWRLTLWFGAILCAILVLSASLLFLLIRNYLYHEVDGNLAVYSARVHGTLNPSELPMPLDYHVLHSKLPAINDFTSPGVFIEILDSAGAIVDKSDNLGTQELPTNRLILDNTSKSLVTTVSLTSGDNTHLRVMASPLDLNGQTLVLQVGESMTFVDTTLRQVALSQAIVTLVALVLTGFLGLFLVRRTLTPVKQITAAARDIEASSDLKRRVGYTGPHDEIGSLAGTFDHLIAHLDQVFDAQKRFVADASHDLRSPLTVVRGNVDILKRPLSDEDRRESIRAIESETGRMSKIVNDLLLLTEIESGAASPPVAVALKDLVFDEVIRARQIAGCRSIVIDHADDIEIPGDNYRLRRMIGNLLDNAVKYTDEDGAISVSLLCVGAEVRLQVTDNGRGISAEHLPHVFDRFYRVEKARSPTQQSTGLGLAIVKSVAEAHGGRVCVESEPGRGSTFSVWLKTGA